MQSMEKLLNAKTGVKAAAILLVVTLFIFAFASMSMGAPGVMPGDVNEDGDIDVRDVVLIMQFILDLRNLTDDQQKAADVNGDEEINVLDATLIMQHILEIKDLAVPITSVEEVEISVPYGTPVGDIEFPETVSATLHDDTEVDIDVEWEDTSDPAYNSQSYNDYTFKGELVDLPAGVFNPDEIQASAVVTVEKLDIPPKRDPVTPEPTTYTVTFAEDNELAGVTVQVFSNSTRTNQVGNDLTTNISGVATINLPDGTYWFTASAEYHLDFMDNFVVDGDSKTVSFEMLVDPDAEYELTLTQEPLEAGTGLTGHGEYKAGTEVPIAATGENPGYEFSEWRASAGSFVYNNEVVESPTWYVYSTERDNAYVMPAQDVTATAHFNVGKLENASAADFVYNEESTIWAFDITEVKLDDGESVTIDLRQALNSELDYSTDNVDYTVDGFDVNAEKADDPEMPEIVLTAEGDVAAGSTVEITVGNIIADNEYSVNTLTFTRNDTGESATATFNILEQYSTYQFVYTTTPESISAGEAVYAEVTFETEQVGGLGYDGVRFAFDADGPDGSTVTFTATDSNNVEHTFINSGYWGPPGGFDVPAVYSAMTKWKLEFSEEGPYTITFSLIEADTEEIIDGTSDSVVVIVGPLE